VNRLERLRVRWAWRRRFTLPARLRRAPQPAPYGYALPRDGVAPALVVLAAVAAIAAGGWLGTLNGGAPAVDPLSLPAPSPTADPAVRDALQALSAARADGRRDLATATTPAAQAAAALGLRRSSLRTAAKVKDAEPAVARALRRSAAAYKALAGAAEAGDARRYARAATAVESAERDFERLVGTIL